MNQNKMAEIMVEQDLSVSNKTSKKTCSIYEITYSGLKYECNYFCKR